MAKFIFRLEKVLQYRKQLEDQAMQALAEATAQKQSLEERVVRLEQDIFQQQSLLSNPQTLSAPERWLVQEYKKALLHDLTEAQHQLVEAEDRVDAYRVDLVKKAQERELLDKLKEKQADRFAQEERLKEQRNYDETATLRYAPASY